MEFDKNVTVPYTVDLRSDTISRPTDDMRNAMRDAKVGDDVYGEDPTVKELEVKIANILGKESALFVPSGTMSNLLAIMVHCDRRGNEAIVGDRSHIFLFEQAGAAQIAHTQLVPLKNNADGTFDLEDVIQKLRINPDVHEPYTSLIVVENTHNMCGGKVVSMAWINDLVTIAKQHNIKLHMDGARLFNASVASKIAPQVIAKNFDSISICLSKGLGAPIGSLLVGSSEFIKKAHRIRKVLGGGMRQVGIIAAAGLVALDQMIDRLADDHCRTRKIAKAVSESNSKFIGVDIHDCATNILILQMLRPNVWSAQKMIERMKTISEKESTEIGNIIVKIGTRGTDWVRLTLYHEITDDDVEMVVKKLLFVIKDLDANHTNCT